MVSSRKNLITCPVVRNSDFFSTEINYKKMSESVHSFTEQLKGQDDSYLEEQRVGLEGEIKRLEGQLRDDKLMLQLIMREIESRKE